MTCALWSYSHEYVTGKIFADIIKVSYQLTLKNFPGDPRNHTSPEKQRSFLLVAGVKSEIPSVRYIQCAYWLEDEGDHRSRKWGPQSYNQKDLALPQVTLQLRTLPSWHLGFQPCKALSRGTNTTTQCPDFWPLGCKLIHAWLWRKPQNPWSSVTVATEN